MFPWPSEVSKNLLPPLLSTISSMAALALFLSTLETELKASCTTFLTAFDGLQIVFVKRH